MSFDSRKLVILSEIDSTNNYAMAMVQKGELKDGDAVFALDQTAGKGRMGKDWKSEKGQNIIVSLIAEMQWLPIQNQFQLSVAVALACFDFFLMNFKENLKIKWPNDIFLNDRKAGGILIENVLKGNLWQWAVIGVGLNINQATFDGNDFKATSLRIETGKSFDVQKQCDLLIPLIFDRIEKLHSGNFREMLNEYNQKLYGLDRAVRLKKGNIIFETKISGVTANGELVTKDALERKFVPNDVILIEKV
jgi:BirA family transcriptional regulator, biotin operon repressor / biotin---[acetyl-CoA-carboxylase] ligase